MTLVVYADESGTHDKTGQQPGSSEATVNGILAPKEDWILFRRAWQATLLKYGASHFHFREWNQALAVAKNVMPASAGFQKKNPYNGWNENKLKDFLIELAKIAGSGNKVLVGGFVNTKNVYKEKLEGNILHEEDPYKGCIFEFFYSINDMLQQQRRPWKNLPVSFIFDQTNDREWKANLLDVFRLFKQKYPKYSEPIFGDKKLYEFLPLQAADMLAYRHRIITGKYINQDFTGQWPELDDALYKNTFDYFSRNAQKVMSDYISGKMR